VNNNFCWNCGTPGEWPRRTFLYKEVWSTDARVCRECWDEIMAEPEEEKKNEGKS
jgi:hypothetical protein